MAALAGVKERAALWKIVVVAAAFHVQRKYAAGTAGESSGVEQRAAVVKERMESCVAHTERSNCCSAY